MKALGRLTLLQRSFDGVLPEIQEDELAHLPSFLYKVLPLSLLLMASQDLSHEETMQRQTPSCPGGSAENNFPQAVGNLAGAGSGAQLLTAGPSSRQGRPGYLYSSTPGITDFHSVLFSNYQGCARSYARQGGGCTGRSLAPGSLGYVGQG